ncbi:hypothetical protein [Stutzerimonas stutzeri]|nr:hypothetical protein [Stutzerimonas stutzeri]
MPEALIGSVHAARVPLLGVGLYSGLTRNGSRLALRGRTRALP